MSALIANDDVESFGQQIDDLAFAFIAPLGADDCYNGHIVAISRLQLAVYNNSQEKTIMSATFNPELASLREKVEAQGSQISEIRGSLQQLDKIVSATTRQSVWQLIALIVSLSIAIVGGLAYQTAMIDKRIDQIEKRFEQIDKRIDQLGQRIELSEKNITARFEDLKQEVRAQRK